MKCFSAIVFLLLYLSAVIRPFVPLLDYAINKDYIATRLCVNRDKPAMHCNGKCYLARQLQRAATGTADSKANLPRPDVKSHIPGVATRQLFSPAMGIPAVIYQVFYISLIPDYYNPPLVPPPRMMV